VSDMELSDNSGPVIFDLMKSPIKDLVQIKGSKNAEELNKYFENQDEILEEDKSQSDIESDNLLQKKLVLSKSKSAHVLPLTQAGKKFRSLNDLVFEKKVGEGAFGKVYRALHKESDTIYAVKSINVKYMQKVNRYHEIINEQKILEVLRDHPRIVHYYEVIQKQNMIYMVFDFAIGGDLQKWLKGRGKLDFKTGQFYIAQLVNIIAHMKVNNVTHRDLKPGNILLNEKFQLVLADFGTSIFNVQYSSESESSSSADLSNSVDSSSSKEGDLSNLKLN
jgi:tRNA A-37 threonylcarbamoyl transferase component Bud32